MRNIDDFFRRLVGKTDRWCGLWACTVFTFLFPLSTFLFPLGTLAQTRIMLASDPHVMGPGLLIEDGEAWYNTVTFDRKLNDYSRDIFDELIATALREKPDLFLLTGDLTKDGELLSHQYVVSQLQRLKDAGIQPLVIPGNHDMGTDEACYYIGAYIEMAETATTDMFAEMYRPFGYGDGSEREETTLTYCCEPVDGLVIIGIDSGHDDDPLNGVVSETALAWVVERATAATAAGKQVFVMMHHSVLPHVHHVQNISSTYAVKYGEWTSGAYAYHSYSTVRNQLIAAGVRVLMSGHTHVNDIARDFSSDRSSSIFDISTATTAAYPCPYRMLTLSKDMKRLDITTRYISSLPGVDGFRDMARRRMIDGMMNLTSQFFDDEELARLCANIFLLHVEGDEDKSPDAETYRQTFQDSLPALRNDEHVQEALELFLLDFEDLEEMVYGLLEDKSHYGSSREDKTDDLRLSIDLTGGGKVVGIPAVARPADDDYYYTLQGIRLKEPSRKGVYIRNRRLIVNR